LVGAGEWRDLNRTTGRGGGKKINRGHRKGKKKRLGGTRS